MKLLRQLSGRTTTSLALFAGGLLACSSQVGSDYQGEPIATLKGVVATSQGLDEVPEVHAAIVWSTWSADGPVIVGERIEVTGSFPANFALSLYAAPPAEAEVKGPIAYCVSDAENGDYDMQSPDGPPCEGLLIPERTGVGMWGGYLAAIRADAPEGELDSGDIVGIDPDHVLLYHDHASDDPLPAMPTAEQAARALDFATLGADLEHDTGYLLLEKNPAFEAELANTGTSALPPFLEPSGNGLGEPITIQLGLGFEDARL